MKLGAVPSIILLLVTAYLAIPSEANILFILIDTITSGFCPDVSGVCNLIPLLKVTTNIIAALGFVGTLFSIIGQLLKGEFFKVKKKS